MSVRRQLKDARAAAKSMLTAPGAADFLDQLHGSPLDIAVSPKVRRFSSRDWPTQNMIARYREFKGAGDSLPRIATPKPTPEGDRRCEHCCEVFRTVLELKGHTEVCSLNSKTRCRHCSKRFACKADKTEHEVVCEFNADNCCEWCGKIFGHQTLKNRHQQRCPMDPKRICSFCRKGFRSNAETVQHEVFCGMNPKTNAVNADCVACGDAATRCVRFPCGDHYCASCLWKLVKTALSDRSLLPLRCCRKPVEAGDVVDLTVALLLPEKECKKYQEAMLLKSSRNVMYCPRISCGALISLDHVPQDVMNQAEPYGCPSCHWPLCFSCKSEWHEGIGCEQYKFLASKDGDAIMKFCKQQNWMKCTTCDNYIEKSAGCDHIVCRCGGEFCYRCGSKWGTCRCQVVGTGHALRHNRVEFNVRQYMCPHCSQPYPSEMEMQVHVRNCREALRALGGAFQCANCLTRCNTQEELREHRRSCMAAINNSYECSMCRVAAQEELREHRRSCMAVINSSLECSVCADGLRPDRWQFPNRTRLNQHSRRVHGTLATVEPAGPTRFAVSCC